MKYNKNTNYFKNVDTAEKAYILGFIYADGYNSGYKLELSQNESRIDILYKILKELKSDAPITKQKDKDIYILDINSCKMCKDLSVLGATKAKSLTLEFPSFLDKSLIRHFIRGYFDGDGCVWIGKRKEYLTKVRIGLYRFKSVLNMKFTFTGNINFISELQNWLVKNSGFTKTKLNFSKAKNPNNSTCDKVCTMEYSGRNNLKRLYNLMYENATIYCDEKYNKFNLIFCALDEKSSIETVLIEETAEMPIVNQASNIKEEGSSTIPEMGVESSDSKCTAPNK